MEREEVRKAVRGHITRLAGPDTDSRFDSQHDGQLSEDREQCCVADMGQTKVEQGFS